MTLTLLLSSAIFVLSLMLLRHAFARWRREHLTAAAAGLAKPGVGYDVGAGP